MARDEGQVVTEAVYATAVPLLHNPRQFGPGAGDGDGIQDVVVDEGGHVGPTAVACQHAQLFSCLLPAMQFGQHPVSGGTHVKGDLLLDEAFGPGGIGGVVGGDGEDGRVHTEIGPRSFPFGQPGCQMGQRVLVKVFHGMDGMNMHSFAQFTGQPQHLFVHGRNVNGRVGVGDGAGIKKGGHQLEQEKLAFKIERFVMLPAIPQGMDGLNGLAHPLDRFVPFHAQPQHIVGFHLWPQTEDETAVAILRQVPGNVCQNSGGARKGDRYRRAQSQRGAMLRRQRQRQKNIVVGLGRPQAVKPQCLCRLNMGCHFGQIMDKESGIKLHGRCSPLILLLIKSSNLQSQNQTSRQPALDQYAQ